MYIVIAGGGKVGEYLATTLLAKGNYVAVIEQDVATADRLSSALEGRYLVISGDGCGSHFQEDAGIRKADAFVATTGQDDNNLVSCEIAQRVFNVPRVIARVNSPKNLRIFRELGIECVSSTTLIAKLIEEETMLGSISIASLLTSGNIELLEVKIPRSFSEDVESYAAQDIELPSGALLVAIESSDGVSVVSEDTLITPGDTAIVACDSQLGEDVREILRSL